jgi:alanine dehydrogenase
LTNATFPYLLELANKGLERACAARPALSAGVNTYNGYVTHEGVAESQGRAWKTLTSVG